MFCSQSQEQGLIESNAAKVAQLRWELKHSLATFCGPKSLANFGKKHL